MAINFPTAPANNTVYPAPPSDFPYRYKSAVPAYWQDMRGTAQRFNRFVNSAFQINVINYMTDTTNLNGVYVADLWLGHFTSDTATLRQQLIDSPTPGGGTRRTRLTVNVADTTPAAGEWAGWNTRMEGSHMADLQWGTANAVPLIVRFGWRSPAGTYTFAIRNHVIDRSYLVPFTITAGQANTDTVQVLSILGDTAGTWAKDNTLHSYINWGIANVNTTSAGNINKWVAVNALAASGLQTNGLAVAGNVFELFDTGMYADPHRTGVPPVYEVPSIADELIRVQRYIQRCYTLKGITINGTTAERMGSTFTVPMRIIPALSVKYSPRIWDGSVGPIVTSVGTSYSTRNFVECGLVCSAGGFTAQRSANFYNFSGGLGTDNIYARADL